MEDLYMFGNIHIKKVITTKGYWVSHSVTGTGTSRQEQNSKSHCRSAVERISAATTIEDHIWTWTMDSGHCGYGCCHSTTLSAAQELGLLHPLPTSDRVTSGSFFVSLVLFSESGVGTSACQASVLWLCLGKASILHFHLLEWKADSASHQNS